MKFIVGKKREMSQRFLADGSFVPVTRISAGPCFITGKMAYAKGQSVQVAYKEMPVKKMNKPQKGFLKKVFNKEAGYKHLKEFRLDGDVVFEKLNVGDEINASIFQVGDIVDVQGVSKGRGFQGVVKRHKFAGGKASHGHKDQLRMPGSIAAKGLGRVPKGTRMGGHMGDDVVTIKNLEVIEINPEKN